MKETPTPVLSTVYVKEEPKRYISRVLFRYFDVSVAFSLPKVPRVHVNGIIFAFAVGVFLRCSLQRVRSTLNLLQTAFYGLGDLGIREPEKGILCSY